MLQGVCEQNSCGCKQQGSSWHYSPGSHIVHCSCNYSSGTQCSRHNTGNPIAHINSLYIFFKLMFNDIQ